MSDKSKLEENLEYNAVIKRLVRELDVVFCGDVAASRASLMDLVSLISPLVVGLRAEISLLKKREQEAYDIIGECSWMIPDDTELDIFAENWYNNYEPADIVKSKQNDV